MEILHLCAHFEVLLSHLMFLSLVALQVFVNSVDIFSLCGHFESFCE